MDTNTKSALSFVMPYVVMIAIALIVLYYIKKKLGQASDSIGLTESDEQKDANKDLANSVIVDYSKLSQPRGSYSVLAQKMYDSMKGLGTDTDAIKLVINSLHNQNDWNMLIKMFGSREGENLFKWLHDEMPTVSHLYGRLDLSDLNKILVSKGIKQNLL
jgi:hypothetical protein